MHLPSPSLVYSESFNLGEQQQALLSPLIRQSPIVSGKGGEAKHTPPGRVGGTLLPRAQVKMHCFWTESPLPGKSLETGFNPGCLLIPSRDLLSLEKARNSYQDQVLIWGAEFDWLPWKGNACTLKKPNSNNIVVRTLAFLFAALIPDKILEKLATWKC